MVNHSNGIIIIFLSVLLTHIYYFLHIIGHPIVLFCVPLSAFVQQHDGCVVYTPLRRLGGTDAGLKFNKV